MLVIIVAKEKTQLKFPTKFENDRWTRKAEDEFNLLFLIPNATCLMLDTG